jgi:hypothetical protein
MALVAIPFITHSSYASALFSRLFQTLKAALTRRFGAANLGRQKGESEAMYSSILVPVIALVAWTIVIMVWMVVTRFAAMKRKGISLKGRVGGRGGVQLEGVVEDEVMWKAHNYMHLVEQPTLFYAIALTLAVGHGGGGWSTILAWAYVGFRIVHSLVQTTVNIVTYRFILWALSSLALVGLVVQAVRMVCAYMAYAN